MVTRLLRVAAFALLLVDASTLAAGQSKKFPLNAVLPLSGDIRTGILPNGLKFYVRKNGRP